MAGFGGGFFFSVCWIHLVVVFRWWVLVVEFKSVAGFGGGFFSVFARSIWWWVSVLVGSVWWLGFMMVFLVVGVRW